MVEIELRPGILQEPSPVKDEEELIPVIGEIRGDFEPLPSYIQEMISQWQAERRLQTVELISYPQWVINMY